MWVDVRAARRRRTVAELMQRDIVTVGPETSVRELARLLRRHRISGVPVVDSDGRALGTISATDLLWLSDRVAPHALLGRPVWEDLEALAVRHVMTPDAFGVPPTATLPELLRFFTRTGVHRALVLEEGRVVGIVSVSDLLDLIAGEEEPADHGA